MVRTRHLDRRFTDNRTVDSLARALDEVYIKYHFMSEAQDAVLIQTATATQDVQPSALIQALGSKAVRLADRLLNQPATGMVISAYPDRIVDWSPLCYKWCNVLGTITSAFQELWLDEGGHFTASEPTTGLIQQIGWVHQYDEPTDLHLCLIWPQRFLKRVRIWSHDDDNYIDLINDEELRFYVDGTLSATLTLAGRLRLKGKFVENAYTAETVQTASDSSDGAIEYNETLKTISFGIRNNGSFIRAAELNSSSFRAAKFRESDITPMSGNFYDAYWIWETGANSTNLSLNRLISHLRLVRYDVGGIDNARVEAQRLSEYAL